MLLAFATLGIVATARAAEPARRPPNLLLIVDDDHAAETLGIECPADDYPPMPLRGGRFYDARETTNAL